MKYTERHHIKPFLAFLACWNCMFNCQGTEDIEEINPELPATGHAH
jgi:hypothetical protein